jgi:hypothetical protein
VIRLRSRLVAAVIPVVVATAAIAPAAQASKPTGLLNCAAKVDVRPKTFQLACGDGNIGLVKLSWTRFGGATASGTGVLAVNGCDPTCVDGSVTRTRVRIVATRTRTLGHKRTYTRLALTLRSGKSAGHYGIDAHGPYERNGN